MGARGERQKAWAIRDALLTRCKANRVHLFALRDGDVMESLAAKSGQGSGAEKNLTIRRK
jgi:predicted Zn-dependent protease